MMLSTEQQRRHMIKLVTGIQLVQLDKYFANNNYTHVLKKLTGFQKTSNSLGKIYHNMFIKLLMEIQPISVLLANEPSHLDLQSLPSSH